MGHEPADSSEERISDVIDPVTFAAARHAEGLQWIAKLPSLIEAVYRRWGLERDQGAIRHGYNALVIPVRRGAEQLVLKLAWPAEGLVDEAQGLEAWDGRGMVRMVAADLSAGALLLERLDAGRPLRHLGMPDAIRVAGRLLRRLAVPAPPGFRDVRTLVTATTHSLQEQPARPDCPIPRDWLQTALALARFLSEHAGTDLLIHADLHYDNILVGTREPWLAIDPRPVAGEPEGAVPELLWTGLDDEEDDAEIRLRLATLVESAELNLERAHAWVIVRCVDYWLWGLEHGLTRDPERCRRILHALLGERSHLSA